MEEEKIKKNSKKKIILILVVILILFLAANGYAATQGYNNIFFAINNLINPTEITNAEEILKDRDITISYQSIEIANGLEIQINRLVVKENEAMLYLDVSENENIEVIPYTYVVYDTTYGRKELLGNQATNRENVNSNSRYNEIINLMNFKEDTNILQLEIHDNRYNKIAVLEIKIEEKEIDVLRSSLDKFEKISEVELKKFISDVVRINFFKDKDAITKYHTEEEYKNEVKVLIALDLIGEYAQDEFTGTKRELVNKVLKELTGKEYEDPIELANIVVKYNEKDDSYEYIMGKNEHAIHATCLDVSSIEYTNNIYIANCTYTYITEEAYQNNTIEELPQFTTTVDFKINEEYEYSKFRYLNDPVSIPVESKNDTDTDKFPEKEESNNSSTNITNTISKNNTTNVKNNTTTVKNNTTTVKNNTTTVKNNTTNDINNTTNVIANTVTNTNDNTGDSDIINKSEQQNTKPEKEEQIDNYASTMQWVTLYTPGLKTRVPLDWFVEVLDNGYSGEHENGKEATIVTGLARGINRETNEIIDSNMKITYYMPEFLDGEKSVEEYGDMLCNKFGLINTGCGYSKGEVKGINWLELSDYKNIEYYCHVEHINGANGIETIGYFVKIETDNPNNYKCTNIINWIFGDIKTISF